MGNFKGSIYSSSLQMTTAVNIIIPERSNDVDPIIEGKPRVLFLLHGLSGNCDEWPRFSKIEYYAKKYNFFIVMPEVQRSFYCNTRDGIAYFDYIADELPKYIETWFDVDMSRRNVFIAGESMGGYGAVKIALSRPQRFSAVASLSGVLDYSSFIQLVKQGVFNEMRIEEFANLDDKDDPISLAKGIAKDPDRPRLIQLCGTEDFLYENNQNFRNALMEVNYGHSYMEAPGEHAWPYWDKAIQYAFMFFLRLDPENTPIY